VKRKTEKKDGAMQTVNSTEGQAWSNLGGISKNLKKRRQSSKKKGFGGWGVEK